MRTLVLASLLLSSAALAEDTAITPRVDHSRVFGHVALFGGWSAGTSFNGPGLGVAAGVGAQLNDRFAITAQLRAATIVVLSFGAAWGQLEYSPVDAFSLGLGFGAHLNHALIAQKLEVLPTIPLSFAFNFPGRDAAGRRSGWRIGADFAFSPAPTTIAFWAGLAVGGVWR